MKRFLSVKGILVVLILALVTLSSGTALAGRQAGVAPQDSLVRLDGATIVTNSLCFESESEITIWGSGWGSGELILVSVVRGADDAIPFFSGSVNPAGAFEVVKTIQAKRPSRGVSPLVKFPGAGLFTLEALGVSGRLTTTPALFVEDKCPATDSMVSMDST